MQLENMSREQLMELARKHEQELAEARASMVAMPLVSDEELAQQGGGELPQDELPPLPNPAHDVDAWVTRDYGRKTCVETLEANGEYFTADQMQEYARAALAQRAASVPAQHVGYFIKEGIAWVQTSSDDPRGVKFYADSVPAQAVGLFYRLPDGLLRQVDPDMVKAFPNDPGRVALFAAPVPAASVQTGPDNLFDLIREWAHLPEGERGQAARNIIGCVNRSYSAGVADGKVLGALAATQPDSGRDAALVAAATALAWKWHRDAVKDGFACSEPAQELFEVLGWPADAATQPAPEVASVQPVAVPLTHEQIRQIFMASGFTIKEGQTDLKDYVYKAAYALIKAAAPSAPAVQVQECECETCHGSGIVDDGEIDRYSNGEPFENGPVKCIKDCPDCAAPAQPASPNPQDAVDAACQNPKWIRVDQQLPQPITQIWVYRRSRNRGFEVLTYYVGSHPDRDMDGFKVTHWMPLVKPAGPEHVTTNNQPKE